MGAHNRPAWWGVATACLALAVSGSARSASLPLVEGVELQPLAAHVQRVAQALELTGSPLTESQQDALRAALSLEDAGAAVEAIQRVFDPLCLAGVTINPESRVKVAEGDAPRELVEQGWRVFLVKVNNQAGVTAPLGCTSPNAAPMHQKDDGDAEPPQTITQGDVVERWLDVSVYDKPPLRERLSGLELEYWVIELFSRDRGRREAKLAFDVGQGTQDLGFRSEVNMLFDCRPCVGVKLEVLDDDGTPTTGQFTFRDARGRVYPARSRRLAPDFFFHDQVYRRHGEVVLLPAGKYRATYTRGPEYVVAEREFEVPQSGSPTERFELKRWIDMAAAGWYSGDHHVHAAGCAHYSAPTQGVTPADMMRHIVGEDLNVGCVLTWGPCWYHQKENFDGRVHPLSTGRHLMRYDVEVSGFPSSHAGHVVLLRIKEDDYPGTTRIEEWPSWDLPVLRWGQEQGGVVGFAHSGLGLKVDGKTLPSYEVPAFDGIGANEYIVDVTHGVCDFISAVDTPFVWELNIWYHALNCGFTTRISGETDFPCMYGERVGLGRGYVKLDRDGPLDFDQWVEGIRDGRSYCCDGLTHLFDFEVNGLGVGEAGDGGRKSVLAVKRGDALKVKCKATALLAETASASRMSRRDLGEDWGEQPYWHIERARIEGTRQATVELVVNGVAVDKRLIEADGSVADLEFDYRPELSCWVALRVVPAAHTNPVFVEVDGAPIRASQRSARWCLAAVDRCWESKSSQIRPGELEAARAAYDHAREVYQRILAEAYDDAGPGGSGSDDRE